MNGEHWPEPGGCGEDWAQWEITLMEHVLTEYNQMIEKIKWFNPETILLNAALWDQWEEARKTPGAERLARVVNLTTLLRSGTVPEPAFLLTGPVMYIDLARVGADPLQTKDTPGRPVTLPRLSTYSLGPASPERTRAVEQTDRVQLVTTNADYLTYWMPSEPTSLDVILTYQQLRARDEVGQEAALDTANTATRVNLKTAGRFTSHVQHKP